MLASNWRKDPANEKLVPAVKPGTRIDYSGEAIFWLQLVVETLTGESLDQSMQRLLFGPAGMRDSSYTWSRELAARSVYGHRAVEDEDPGMPPQMLRDTWNAAQTVADRWGKPLSAWQALGVRQLDGSPLPAVDMQASLIRPDDVHGRSYLAYENYRVLRHWNRSPYFVVAVGTLADRIVE